MPPRRGTNRDRVGKKPQVARWLARCRGCGIEGRTVDPVPPDMPNGSWLKTYYEPVIAGLCAQCARVLASR